MKTTNSPTKKKPITPPDATAPDLATLAAQVTRARMALERAKDEAERIDRDYRVAFFQSQRDAAAAKRSQIDNLAVATAEPLTVDQYKLLCLTPGAIQATECRLIGDAANGWTLLIRDHDSRQMRKLDLNASLPRHPRAFRALLDSLRMEPPVPACTMQRTPFDRVLEAATILQTDADRALAAMDATGADWHTARAFAHRFIREGGRLDLPVGLTDGRFTMPPEEHISRENGVERRRVIRPPVRANLVDRNFQPKHHADEQRKIDGEIRAAWTAEYNAALETLAKYIAELKAGEAAVA